MELIEVKINMGSKGDAWYNLWKGDVNFKDPQIQIHSPTVLHFYAYYAYMYISHNSNVILKYFHFSLLVIFF